MQVEATLTYTDATGHTRSVIVSARYFSIGRNPENNLQIDNSSLSRQHALVECFDDFLQITDCGSQNGTAVNGAPVMGAVELRDGDVITLGEVLDLKVGVRAAAVPISTAAAQSHAAFLLAASSSSDISGAHEAAKPLASHNQPRPAWWMSVPVLAATAAAVFVMLAAVVLLVVSRDNRRSPGERRGAQQENRKKPEDPAKIIGVLESQTPSARENLATLDIASTPTRSSGTITLPSDSAALVQVERSAEQVMRRISTDSKDYSFSEKAVRDIAQKIDSYRASSAPVREALISLRKGGPSIAAAARNEGITPYFVLYAALAQTDGGRAGRDALTTAQAMLPELIALRTTLGHTPDSSLLVIAAYPEGIGTKKSHPLLGRMRGRIEDPITQRNVWYLHEHGGINAEAYDLVIRFLALGVIAQNPKQFGVNAEPLAF